MMRSVPVAVVPWRCTLYHQAALALSVQVWKRDAWKWANLSARAAAVASSQS